MLSTLLRQVMGATVIEQRDGQTFVGVAIHGRTNTDGSVELMWNHSTSPTLVRFGTDVWKIDIVRQVILLTRKQTDAPPGHGLLPQTHQVFIVLQPR